MNETEWKCKIHNEQLLWGGGEDPYTACISCLTDDIIRLRTWNNRLRNQLREERILRGSAQRKIGKLMIIQEGMDHWIDGLAIILKRGLDVLDKELKGE